MIDDDLIKKLIYKYFNEIKNAELTVIHNDKDNIFYIIRVNGSGMFRKEYLAKNGMFINSLALALGADIRVKFETETEAKEYIKRLNSIKQMKDACE